VTMGGRRPPSSFGPSYMSAIYFLAGPQSTRRKALSPLVISPKPTKKLLKINRQRVKKRQKTWSQSGDGSRNKAPTAEQDPRRCIAARNYSAGRVDADAATVFDDLAICRVPRWPAAVLQSRSLLIRTTEHTCTCRDIFN
jgi:hypothetical protein